jgi:AhpD family alkylhydroperoxidase
MFDGEFSKVIYSPKLFFEDIKFLLCNLSRLWEVSRGVRISRTMAEKIILAVTSVNQCVYCARFHSWLAASQGVDPEEIKSILAMDIKQSVDDCELTALLFAQHYAEKKRQPEAAAVENLVQKYGRDKANDILLIIRFIYFGNLSGNTYDAFKSRLRGKPAKNGNVILEILISIFFLLLVIPVQNILQRVIR